MLKKRVIFTLLYNNGNFMLSRNFRLQKVGDINWLEKNYNFSQVAFSIDELIILDVTRDDRDEDRFFEHVKALNDVSFVPIAAGGGIRSVEQARRLLRSGADKVVVNSLFDKDPDVIGLISAEFGRQCVVASVDVKRSDDRFEVWTRNGTKRQNAPAQEWITSLLSLPIGEIYLNSMDRDGTGQGYLGSLLDLIPESIQVPVILAGGAGKYSHLAEGLQNPRVDAVATAHLFNFVGNGLELARKGLLDEGFNLARWDIEKAVELKQAAVV